MSPVLIAALVIAEVILFVGLPALTLAYAVVFRRLDRRQPVSGPVRGASGLMLGLWLAAVAAFLVSATFHPAPRGYPVAWLGVTLVGGGTVAGATLLFQRPKPVILARLGWPLTIGGLLLTAFLAISIHIAALAYEIGRHSDPDIGAVRAALARDPNDSAAHMSLGYDLMIRRDTQGAAGEFQRAARLEPPGSRYRDEASFMLGRMLMKEGRRAQAMATYRQLAMQDDEWGRAAKRYVDHDAGGP